MIIDVYFVCVYVLKMLWRWLMLSCLGASATSRVGAVAMLGYWDDWSVVCVVCRVGMCVSDVGGKMVSLFSVIVSLGVFMMDDWV